MKSEYAAGRTWGTGNTESTFHLHLSTTNEVALADKNLWM
jgi:hypothetical protein